jgi:hypothetical protein
LKRVYITKYRKKTKEDIPEMKMMYYPVKVKVSRYRPKPALGNPVG